MEPSSVEDGNIVGELNQIQSTLTSMEPSSVEDGNSGTGVPAITVALVTSMEPSSVEDGNHRTPQNAPEASTALQWSRPQLRTETP